MVLWDKLVLMHLPLEEMVGLVDTLPLEALQLDIQEVEEQVLLVVVVT